MGRDKHTKARELVSLWQTAHLTNVITLQASSSAAALRLSASQTGFVGFQALQGLAYVPDADPSSQQDSTLDPAVRAALKKLSKKDATTKIKVRRSGVRKRMVG
jgi:hypothetical protein